MTAESFALVARAVATVLWPLALVLALVLFRRPIGRALDRVLSANVGPVGVTLSDALRESADDLTTIAKDVTERRDEVVEIADRLRWLGATISSDGGQSVLIGGGFNNRIDAPHAVLRGGSASER